MYRAYKIRIEAVHLQLNEAYEREYISSNSNNLIIHIRLQCRALFLSYLWSRVHHIIKQDINLLSCLHNCYQHLLQYVIKGAHFLHHCLLYPVQHVSLLILIIFILFCRHCRYKICYIFSKVFFIYSLHDVIPLLLCVYPN